MGWERGHPARKRAAGAKFFDQAEVIMNRNRGFALRAHLQAGCLRSQVSAHASNQGCLGMAVEE